MAPHLIIPSHMIVKSLTIYCQGSHTLDSPLSGVLYPIYLFHHIPFPSSLSHTALQSPPILSLALYFRFYCMFSPFLDAPPQGGICFWTLQSQTMVHVHFLLARDPQIFSLWIPSASRHKPRSCLAGIPLHLHALNLCISCGLLKKYTWTYWNVRNKDVLYLYFPNIFLPRPPPSHPWMYLSNSTSSIRICLFLAELLSLLKHQYLLNISMLLPPPSSMHAQFINPCQHLSNSISCMEIYSSHAEVLQNHFQTNWNTGIHMKNYLYLHDFSSIFYDLCTHRELWTMSFKLHITNLVVEALCYRKSVTHLFWIYMATKKQDGAPALQRCTQWAKSLNILETSCADF